LALAFSMILGLPMVRLIARACAGVRPDDVRVEAAPLFLVSDGGGTESVRVRVSVTEERSKRTPRFSDEKRQREKAAGACGGSLSGEAAAPCERRTNYVRTQVKTQQICWKHAQMQTHR